MTKNCCICKKIRSSRSPLRSYFRFPIKPELSDKWAENIGRPDIIDKTPELRRKYYVCNEHFAVSAFPYGFAKSSHLRKDAVPAPSLSKPPESIAPEIAREVEVEAESMDSDTEVPEVYTPFQDHCYSSPPDSNPKPQPKSVSVKHRSVQTPYKLGQDPSLGKYRKQIKALRRKLLYIQEKQAREELKPKPITAEDFFQFVDENFEPAVRLFIRTQYKSRKSKSKSGRKQMLQPLVLNDLAWRSCDCIGDSD